MKMYDSLLAADPVNLHRRPHGWVGESDMGWGYSEEVGGGRSGGKTGKGWNWLGNLGNILIPTSGPFGLAQEDLHQ